MRLRFGQRFISADMVACDQWASIGNDAEWPNRRLTADNDSCDPASTGGICRYRSSAIEGIMEAFSALAVLAFIVLLFLVFRAIVLR